MVIIMKMMVVMVMVIKNLCIEEEKSALVIIKINLQLHVSHKYVFMLEEAFKLQYNILRFYFVILHQEHERANERTQEKDISKTN